MNLSFSTNYKNSEPTYFIDKIWDSLVDFSIVAQHTRDFYFQLYVKKFNRIWDSVPNVCPKKHTIRKDEHNIWKAGMKIHFVINNRTKKRFQFAPVMVCKSVQRIEIRYTHHETKIGTFECVAVRIDGRFLDYYEIEKLAINDGFSSFGHFLKWFDNDFTGKIIHWTDLKY